MHYYSHNIADYRKDTSHLSFLEHGIYRQLLDSYYLDEMPLNADFSKLMRSHSIRTTDERSALENVLLDFFELTEKGYIHKRCDEVIAVYHGKSDKARQSANTRWQGSKGKKGKSDANAMRTHSDGNAIGMLTNNHKPITNIKHTTPIGFDLFWDAYDKKVGKPNSIKAWAKINFEKYPVQEIVDCAKKDKLAKPDSKFRKDPERWLRGQHWLDELIVSHETSKELPLGTDAQIAAAYRAECGDPAKSTFNSYYDMRNFIVAQREKRAKL
jgi:uncharacterized protein YdaU (DUF1376 family)